MLKRLNCFFPIFWLLHKRFKRCKKLQSENFVVFTQLKKKGNSLSSFESDEEDKNKLEPEDLFDITVMLIEHEYRV